MNQEPSLASFGWQPFFQQQLTLEEHESALPARIVEQHRNEFEVITAQGSQVIQIGSSMPQMTVGDWVLLREDRSFARLLDRQSCFRRKVAGGRFEEQLIAANVDTAFIVCSLNDDFSLNRIERYLAMVHDAGAEPVVVLTKRDLCAQAEALQQQVQALGSLLAVHAVNGLMAAARDQLMPWCGNGRTVVMLGSSGAGKSTLTNTLLGEQVQATAAIRDEDSKGRHTTTQRSLLAMPGGAMLLDTPGMRELQLVDMAEGVTATFADVEELTRQCRFNDCGHQSEPGCAIRAAIAGGELDERRFLNYEKLMREQAMNAASLAQKRANDKKLGKYYKRTLSQSVRNKRGED